MTDKSAGGQAMSAPCHWSYDEFEDSWNTTCGNKYLFFDSGPADNGFHFCPYCGADLVEEVCVPT